MITDLLWTILFTFKLWLSTLGTKSKSTRENTNSSKKSSKKNFICSLSSAFRSSIKKPEIFKSKGYNKNE